MLKFRKISDKLAKNPGSIYIRTPCNEIDVYNGTKISCSSSYIHIFGKLILNVLFAFVVARNRNDDRSHYYQRFDYMGRTI